MIKLAASICNQNVTICNKNTMICNINDTNYDKQIVKFLLQIDAVFHVYYILKRLCQEIIFNPSQCM